MFRKERNNMDSLRYFLIEAKKQTYANDDDASLEAGFP